MSHLERRVLIGDGLLDGLDCLLLGRDFELDLCVGLCFGKSEN